MPSSAPSLPEITPRERRSLFGNYAAATPTGAPAAAEAAPAVAAPSGSAETALARSYLYQFLARCFEDPNPAGWEWLTSEETRRAVTAAVEALGTGAHESLRSAFAALREALEPSHYALFHDTYVAAIGHAARGSSPINEIEYGDLRADPLFQPHRLADVGAFYRVFGVELGADAGERHDHLAVELEFMAVLVGQEAYALTQASVGAALDVNRDAQRLFLREHLGRWCPAFARRLRGMVDDGALGRAAGCLLEFVGAECRRQRIPESAGDLLLRPADEGASLCDKCGLTEGLPGAAGAAETD